LASKGFKKATLALSGRDSSVKTWGVESHLKKMNNKVMDGLGWFIVISIVFVAFLTGNSIKYNAGIFKKLFYGILTLVTFFTFMYLISHRQ
jgi:hypothetical protein